jgi:hypothetical protein
LKEKVVKQEKVIVQPSLLEPSQQNTLSKSENIDFGDFEL